MYIYRIDNYLHAAHAPERERERAIVESAPRNRPRLEPYVYDVPSLVRNTFPARIRVCTRVIFPPYYKSARTIAYSLLIIQKL